MCVVWVIKRADSKSNEAESTSGKKKFSVAKLGWFAAVICSQPLVSGEMMLWTWRHSQRINLCNFRIIYVLQNFKHFFCHKIEIVCKLCQSKKIWALAIRQTMCKYMKRKFDFFIGYRNTFFTKIDCSHCIWPFCFLHKSFFIGSRQFF